MKEIYVSISGGFLGHYPKAFAAICFHTTPSDEFQFCKVANKLFIHRILGQPLADERLKQPEYRTIEEKGIAVLF